MSGSPSRISSARSVRARTPGTVPVGSSHLSLRVEDLDAVLERVERFGGHQVTDPVDVDRGMNAGARAVYLRDPDGYTVELIQSPPVR